MNDWAAVLGEDLTDDNLELKMKSDSENGGHLGIKWLVLLLKMTASSCISFQFPTCTMFFIHLCFGPFCPSFFKYFVPFSPSLTIKLQLEYVLFSKSFSNSSDRVTASFLSVFIYCTYLHYTNFNIGIFLICNFNIAS